MLSRAALPLLRRRAVPVGTRISIAACHARIYAPASLRPSNPSAFKYFSSTPSSYTKSDPNQKDKSDKPSDQSYSEAQTEFETNTESLKNEAPKSTGAGSGVNEGHDATSDRQADFSETQTEFETTSKSPKDEAESEPAPSQQQIPDLTQGIPSTLGAEIEAQAKRRGATSLNLTEDPEKGSEGEGGDGGRGDIPKNAYVSSLERRRNRLTNLTFAALIGLAISGTMYLGRNWDTKEEEDAHPDAPSGWGFKMFFNRMGARTSDLTSYYKDPPFEKLLPEDDPQLRQPYTLVISLEDLLVHSEWSRDHGWRVAKRPGVDYFLRYLNQYYELVLFTSVPSMMADQVLRKLDPYRIIRWPLFREATKYEDGEYVKDLSYLNRDLSKVIMVDTHEPHAKRQPENAIILPKWNGDPKDKSLVSLIPFLEYVAGMGVDDVRPVIKGFEGTYIPAEFAKREKAMREKFEAQLAEERKKRPKHSVSSIGSLFGIKPTPSVISGMDGTPSDGLEEGKMVWDQIRERGQKQYEMVEKEIQENGDKWLAEMAAEEEKAREEQMKGMKSSFTGFFGAGDHK